MNCKKSVEKLIGQTMYAGKAPQVVFESVDEEQHFVQHLHEELAACTDLRRAKAIAMLLSERPLAGDDLVCLCETPEKFTPQLSAAHRALLVEYAVRAARRAAKTNGLDGAVENFATRIEQAAAQNQPALRQAVLPFPKSSNHPVTSAAFKPIDADEKNRLIVSLMNAPSHMLGGDRPVLVGMSDNLHDWVVTEVSIDQLRAASDWRKSTRPMGSGNYYVNNVDVNGTIVSGQVVPYKTFILDRGAGEMTRPIKRPGNKYVVDAHPEMIWVKNIPLDTITVCTLDGNVQVFSSGNTDPYEAFHALDDPTAK